MIALSSRVVEFYGSLAPRLRTAVQASPHNDTGLNFRSPTGGGSQGQAANNTYSAVPRLEVRDLPWPARRPERPPLQPSTSLLTQLLGQKSETGAAKGLDEAIVT